MTLKTKSSVVDGFFPYLAQMITSMRGCVAHNDLWPWTISSRSFDLGLINRVRSVPSTVRDGFFPYLVQMVTSMRKCVACDDLWPWPISSSHNKVSQKTWIYAKYCNAQACFFMWGCMQIGDWASQLGKFYSELLLTYWPTSWGESS